MAKLLTLFLVLIAIQACLIVYHDASPATPATEGGATGSGGTELWQMVMNIDKWNNLAFIASFFGFAALIGVGSIIIGSFMGLKTDFIVFAPAITGFLSMGVIIINLANVVRDDLISYVFRSCSTTGILPCTPANLVTGLIVAPFGVIYIMTVIDWWKGRDQ